MNKPRRARLYGQGALIYHDFDFPSQAIQNDQLTRPMNIQMFEYNRFFHFLSRIAFIELLRSLPLSMLDFYCFPSVVRLAN